MARVGFNYALRAPCHKFTYYAGIMLDALAHLLYAKNYASVIDAGLPLGLGVAVVVAVVVLLQYHAPCMNRQLHAGYCN